MKKILLALTVMAFCLSANADNWIRYDSIYVDSQSLLKLDDNIRAWVIRPHFKKSKFRNREYVYEAFYIDARCKEREVAILTSRWYNRFHELTESTEFGGNDKLEYIKVKPRTNYEIVYKALCSQKGKFF